MGKGWGGWQSGDPSPSHGGGDHTIPWPAAEDVAWAFAATLKRKLVASTAEMRRLKDRVQQLQNELIRVWTPAGAGRGCPRDRVGAEEQGGGRESITAPP